MLKIFQFKPFDSLKRTNSSNIMCSVSFEHAESVKILIASGNCTSALGLFRLQYEAFVRAMWLFFSASDIDLTMIMEELTKESAKKSERLPMLSDMLKQLEGKAPRIALDQLHEFKKYSWKPLSSYIHGGIHALNRHSIGYPLPFLIQLLKASNGLLMMAGMLLVILSTNRGQTTIIPELQFKYQDCLPDFKKNYS